MKMTLSEMGKKGGTAFRHKWTENERNIVRRDYDGTSMSAYYLANRLSSLTGERITFHAIKGQVQMLGLAIDKSRRWTPEEESTLIDLITQFAPATVARILHRSVNSVIVKSKRLHLSLRIRDGWFTKSEVSEILGVDHKKIQKWIDSGELKASYHGEIKPQKKGCACWEIRTPALRDFIINHSFELVGRNVDLFQIVEILVEV